MTEPLEPATLKPRFEDPMDSFPDSTETPEGEFQDRRQAPRRAVIGRARLILATADSGGQEHCYDCVVLESSDRGCRIAADFIPPIKGLFTIEFAGGARSQAVVRWAETNELGLELVETDRPSLASDPE